MCSFCVTIFVATINFLEFCIKPFWESDSKNIVIFYFDVCKGAEIHAFLFVSNFFKVEITVVILAKLANYFNFSKKEKKVK